MELSKEWYSVIVQAIGKDNNFQDTCEDVLTTMLNLHIEILENAYKHAIQVGITKDVHGGYMIGLIEAIALIKQSKPNGK